MTQYIQHLNSIYLKITGVTDKMESVLKIYCIYTVYTPGIKVHNIVGATKNIATTGFSKYTASAEVPA